MVGHLKCGERAPSLYLPTADSGQFESSSLAGRRWLLSFQRYAT